MPRSLHAKLFWLTLLISSMAFMLPQKKITVFSIGDSTMADYNIDELSRTNGGKNYPLRGWMMAMPQFFNDQVIVHNAARSGRSSKSFRTEGHWKKVISQVKTGDYVFIQFGHNDEKSNDTSRYTLPETTFRQNLIRYINETKAKGAHPVLFTSIARRKFVDGKLSDTHGDYVTVPRALAKEMNIPLVDLNRSTSDLIQRMGEKKSKKLFLHIKPGQFSKLPDGKKDDTHLNEKGAEAVAALAVKGIKSLQLPLADYFKK